MVGDQKGGEGSWREHGHMAELYFGAWGKEKPGHMAAVDKCLRGRKGAWAHDSTANMFLYRSGSLDTWQNNMFVRGKEREPGRIGF